MAEVKEEELARAGEDGIATLDVDGDDEEAAAFAIGGMEGVGVAEGNPWGGRMLETQKELLYRLSSAAVVCVRSR